MPDYSKGKIYKIINNVNDDIYIGSTTQDLADRMGGHRVGYKRWKEGKGNTCSSFELFENYGVKNCKIIWLEDYPCDSKRKLEAREQYFIDTMKCINKNNAFSGIEISCKENPVEYHNKYAKKYYEDNKEKIKDQMKEYQEANKNKLKEYQKEYREDKKEKIHKKFSCECGGKYTKQNETIHEKSKKHQNFLTKSV